MMWILKNLIISRLKKSWTFCLISFSSHLASILTNIPGTSEKDSLSYRIEALRYFLEKEIGADNFLKAYNHI